VIGEDDILQITDQSCALFELTRRFGSDPPLKRIFQIVLCQDCRTILLENNYEDDEWLSEYDLFYSKIFNKPPRVAQRIHFFSCHLKKESLCNLSDYQEFYLGYCVLRPLENHKVSAAIIRPILDNNNPKKSFILCKERFSADIEIDKDDVQHLEVIGFPFIQQDGQLGCCSHVALAMVDSFLFQSEYKPVRETNKDQPYLVANIVESVSSVPELQRLIPSEGLLPIQISEALKKMGYFPLVYEYGKGKERPISADKIIYYYLESKLPIIVGIPTSTGKHALTVIGHSFEPELWWAIAHKPYYNRRPSGIDYHCSTTWLQNFIVQDDNFGPYLTIPKEIIWSLEKDGLLVIVPLPPNTNIKGEDAEAIAYTLIQSAMKVRKQRLRYLAHIEEQTKVIHIKVSDWFDILWEHLENDDLVLRTWLLPSKEFKKKYVSSSVKDIYNNLKMPDKIWLTEVSIPELFCQSRLRLGEVVIDPTSSKFRTSFLSIHLPGFIIARNIYEDEQKLFEITNDMPFTHVMRE